MRVAQLFFPALGLIPRGVLRRLAGRYITGESIADLVEVATALDASGVLSTADVLGENSLDLTAVDRIVEEYRRLIGALSDRVPRSEVSVKPTLIGLRLGE
jgi:proline dehydrogenase